MKQIDIKRDILKNNNDIARDTRELLKDKGVFTIDLVGTPGAGKTAILEQLLDEMKEDIKIAVIEGDLYTAKDAGRIEKHGVDVVQINTGGACHLDANMVRKAIDFINIDEVDLLVVENVGNLVCPASYDLSEDMKIIVSSVTEGNDKPLKYPPMFQKSKAVIINKIDLIDYTDFNIEEFCQDVVSINETAKIFKVSSKSKEGISDLCNFISDLIVTKKKGL